MNVKIINTVVMGEENFFKIQSLNLAGEQYGYVSVSSVIVILSAGSPRHLGI